MPRSSRIVIAGYRHHIIQRRHNKQTVFASDKDYFYYLDNLKMWKEVYGCKVYAYCLMTNQVHLIIDPGQDPGNIALLMKRIAGRQTRYVNMLEKRTGIYEKVDINRARSVPTNIFWRVVVMLNGIQFVPALLQTRLNTADPATA